MNKTQLRQHFKALRHKLSSRERETAAEAAAKLCIAMPIFQRAIHIACYLAFKGEINTAAIIEEIWQHKKKCYLPVLDSDNQTLMFAPYHYGDALHKNRYGILEPKSTQACLNPDLLDLVVVPLIAYDRKGTRLGSGGGFYDKTFANNVDDQSKKPFFAGLAFKVQEATELLPTDAWDLKLNAIINESQVLYF